MQTTECTTFGGPSVHRKSQAAQRSVAKTVARGTVISGRDGREEEGREGRREGGGGRKGRRSHCEGQELIVRG